ncbi:unnamed protein product, partial [Mesorhabditis belari]|uniref:Uncharacterized protein n=1 Tax=Mesorhabditis belari TaxID=2138241 RepID=A0AAF3F2K1_9BILA
MCIGERIFFLLTTLFLSLYFFISNAPNSREKLDVTTWETISPKYARDLPNLSTNSPKDLFDKCDLKIHNAFDSEISRATLPKDPLEGCNREYTPSTIFENGEISISPNWLKKVRKCQARCHFYKSVTEFTAGEWVELWPNEWKQMECDFVFAQCIGHTGKIVDKHMHTQIFETDFRTVTASPSHHHSSSPNFRPDVHIFLIDSVASTQAQRSLPKTLRFLQDQMNAVLFHHLNKVGDNSRPNGYALLLGKRTVADAREIFGASDLKPEMKFSDTCFKYRDDDPVIFKEYEKAGYKTLNNEEYETGDVWTWPKCFGFQRQPTTHNFRPFPASLHADDFLKKVMSRRNCIEAHHPQFKYHSQFLRAYQGQPKFGLTWLGSLSHDDADQLFHADTYFEKFFRENEELLRNSFVFFMGDHGIRFGNTLNTRLGQRELSNPFLLMTIPERLRQNQQLLSNLNANSHQLLTHFDLHATFVDILKNAFHSNFSSFDFEAVLHPNNNNATSILRPLGPYGDRTCKNIPVPSAYCLCEYEKRNLKDLENYKDLGIAGAGFINKLLIKEKIEELCEKVVLKKIESIEVFEPENATQLYDVVFTVTPNDAKFKMTIKRLGTSFPYKHLHSGVVDRLNKYGSSVKE